MSKFFKKVAKKVRGGSSSSSKGDTSTPSSTPSSLPSYGRRSTSDININIPSRPTSARRSTSDINFNTDVDVTYGDMQRGFEELEDRPETPLSRKSTQSSSSIPLNVVHEGVENEYEEEDDEQPEETEHGAPETQTQAAEGGGGHRAKSFVWTFFRKEQFDTNVWKCTCLVCENARVKPNEPYTWRKGGGTGTLARHLEKKHGITADNATGGSSSGGQSQLHGFFGDMPGGGTPYMYNRDLMIDEFARYVIADELPFNHGESPNLEYFNRVALQPQFKSIPRNTVKRRTIVQYYEAKFELVQMFHSLPCRVSLTTDTWTSTYNESFMCVTAHWIDDNWFLQKRIIAFEPMPERHTGFNIKARLVDVCKTYNLLKNIFSLSVDNATANTKCIDFLKQDNEFNFLLGGRFLHVRCCAHILNLSVQEGIILLSPLLEPIRTVIRWLRIKGKGPIKRRYKQLCAESNLRKKVWSLDTPTRWNSTYDLLCSAMKYRHIITTLYNENISDDEDMLTERSWNVASLVLNVLVAYNTATKTFSLVYEPNIHQVILECVKVVHAINQNIDVPEIREVLQSMKVKWLQYFGDFPHIYGIATMLDPAVKIEGLQNLLSYYYEALDMSEYDVEKYVQECRSILEELHDYYFSLSNPDRQQSRRPPSSSDDRFDPFIADLLFTKKHKSSGKSPAVSGVDDYLCYQFETGSNFQILNWWRNKETNFPILSKIARDVLAIPASTVASESAFSAGRRVLDEKRSTLAPESIEICVCKKDWDQANKRTQGLRYDESDDDDPFMTFNTDSSDASFDPQGRRIEPSLRFD